MDYMNLGSSKLDIRRTQYKTENSKHAKIIKS